MGVREGGASGFVRTGNFPQLDWIAAIFDGRLASAVSCFSRDERHLVRRICSGCRCHHSSAIFSAALLCSSSAQSVDVSISIWCRRYASDWYRRLMCRGLADVMLLHEVEKALWRRQKVCCASTDRNRYTRIRSQHAESRKEELSKKGTMVAASVDPQRRSASFTNDPFLTNFHRLSVLLNDQPGRSIQ